MKSRVLKIVSVCLAVALIVVLIIASIPENSGKSKNVLNVFSWEDYIDEDLLGEFEEYYFDEYGEEITVNYYTFATCEEMFNELKKDPDCCDLMCPSEYMIMQLKDRDMIKEFDTPKIYDENVSPYIREELTKLGIMSESTTYACGYMWGTMGLLYNMDTVDVEDLTYWDALLNEKYKGKITIKDSVRDTYIMALAILYKEDLLQENPDYMEIFNRTDDDTLEGVKNILTDMKKNLYGFEVDSGKSDILTGKIDINSAWSGDAVYSMDLGDEDGITLGYFVPEEGSNVWFDGWVMPKSADEVKASAFIDFLSIPENAARNMDYIGYTSCIAGNEDDSTMFDLAVDWYGLTEEDYNLLEPQEQEEYTCVDLSYFFGGTDEGDYVIYYLSEEEGRQLYAQYSDLETVSRCAIMKNFDDETLGKINDMWSCVKLVTLPLYAILLIAGAFVIVIILLILYALRDKIFISKKTVKYTEKKSKYKILKKENLI